MHRDPVLCTATAGEPLHPRSNIGNSRSLTEGRNEVISTTTRMLHGVTPLSEKHYWSSRRKRTLKTPTAGVQVIKIITKNNSSCVNLNMQ
jgi:hypothetical protein